MVSTRFVPVIWSYQCLPNFPMSKDLWLVLETSECFAGSGVGQLVGGESESGVPLLQFITNSIWTFYSSWLISDIIVMLSFQHYYHSSTMMSLWPHNSTLLHLVYIQLDTCLYFPSLVLLKYAYLSSSQSLLNPHPCLGSIPLQDISSSQVLSHPLLTQLHLLS